MGINSSVLVHTISKGEASMMEGDAGGIVSPGMILMWGS